MTLRTQSLLLGILAVIGSFALGVQTAGDIETVQSSAAEDAVVVGDIDGDGVVTVRDAIVILEFTQDNESPTNRQLQSDPNIDGILTVDDAVMILQSLTFRP